jgi:hypothetical protein
MGARPVRNNDFVLREAASRMMRFQMMGAVAMLLLAIALGGCGQSEIDGVSGLEEPVQTRLQQAFTVANIDEYTITAMDEYTVDALVLSTKRYYMDREANVSPVDFLLAWGPVAEDSAPNDIRWSQGWRWGEYRFEYGDTDLRESTIDRNTANTHIIPDPADPELRSALLSVRRGDVVRMKGYLVNVSAPDGWRWISSRSRHDTGGGACEIFYVTELE